MLTMGKKALELEGKRVGVQQISAEKLGKTQARILEFITAYTREGGICPSFQEIADGVGLATVSTVNYHLKILEKRGLVTRPHGQARSIQLCEPPANDFPRTASHLKVHHLGDSVYIDGWRTLLGVGSVRHQHGTLISIHTSTLSGEPEVHAHLLPPEAPIQYEPKAA
jgi:DNA-binding transcriptional ArsR family regulator